MTIERTYWMVDSILKAGMDGRRQTANRDEAILTSSLCTSGLHAPALDIDFPVQLIERKEEITAEHIRVGGRWLVLHLPFRMPPDAPISDLSSYLERLGLTRWPISMEATDTSPLFAEGTMLVFELAVPATVYTSSQSDHHHVYLEQELTWLDYQELLRLLASCGILGPGFVRRSIERAQTMLLCPGLKKADLAARGVVIGEEKS